MLLVHKHIIDIDSSRLVINDECLVGRENKQKSHGNASSGSKKAKERQSHWINRPISVLPMGTHMGEILHIL